jgi:hypothetical protein
MDAKRKALRIAWVNMRQRCRNPHHPRFPHYGAKGIGIDPRWESFEQFAADMGATWWPGASLHRIRTTMDYELTTVVWLSRGFHSRLHNIIHRDQMREWGRKAHRMRRERQSALQHQLFA